MLFRGTLPATALTRTLTFSEFDHVGIIIRIDGLNDVYIMEALGGPTGVRLSKWSLLEKDVGKDKFYKRIVFRHVNFNRTPEILKKFNKFAKEAMNHKYSLTVDKLMKK